MLTTHFKRPQTPERYRSGPTGPHLDSFTDWLERQGYSSPRIRQLLCGVRQFSRWAQQTDTCLEELDEQALDSFEQYLQNQQRLYHPSGDRSYLFVGAHHFVTFLQSTHRVPSLNSTPPPSSIPPLLVEFRHWMQTHRGTTAKTLNTYCRELIDLLETLGDRPGDYHAEALRQFILKRARQRSADQAKRVVTAVRTFIRFLSATGRCSPGLEHAIPTIALWRLASLPKYLPSEAVEQVIASCDLTTPVGVRDRAVLLLLSRLGLRAGEVASLKLTDLNWDEATVKVAGKSGRAHRLPLSQEVGDAILRYLEQRPHVTCPQVFITAIAPLKALAPASIGDISARAIQRAGVNAPTHGAHVLRHSAATQMLRQGLPLSAIGMILRHCSVETTVGYAKVDFSLLEQVVRPWPEDTLC